MRIEEVLTLLGSIMVWATLIIPVVLSVIVLMQRGVFLFDFLMPIEMSFVFFIGTFLLSWISRKKGPYFKLLLLRITMAAAALLDTQGLAVITGLASGEIDAAGWPLVVVTSSMVI